MVTHFLVPARDCCSIDPQRITEAGGHLIGIGRLEDDGSVVIDVDIEANDREANQRVSAMFAHHFT